MNKAHVVELKNVEPGICLITAPRIKPDTRKRSAEFHKMGGNFEDYAKAPGNYLYIIENKVNGKIYAGMTTNLKHRLVVYGDDVKKNEKTSSLIVRAIRKYGFENFDFNIIRRYETVKEVSDNEIALIAELKELGFVMYNITLGGEHALDPSLYGKSGTKHNVAKLNIDQINEIFEKYFEGKATITEMTSEYKVCRSAILNLLHGRTYQEETKDLIVKYGIVKDIKNKKITPRIQCKNPKLNRGEDNKATKLSRSNVISIIEYYFDTDISIIELSKKYGVVASTIVWILKGKNWIHMTKEMLTKYKDHPKSMFDGENGFSRRGINK